MAGPTHTNAPHEDRDHITGTATTGHEWDGIKELNTPLPRWWVNIFYACIIWSFGYWVVYPSWPMVSSHMTGVIGYSSRAEVQVELEALKARRTAQAADLGKIELAAIKSDPKLLSLALAQGKAAFGDNCAPCHGLGGAGSKGYPNLNDDDWLWGGSLDEIHVTLQHGIRSGNDDKTPDFGDAGLRSGWHPQEGGGSHRRQFRPDTCRATGGSRVRSRPPGPSSLPKIARRAMAMPARATRNSARRT